MINVAQDTFFRKNKLLNCNGQLLDLSTPVVMGILNITPDSFFKNSRVTDLNESVNSAGQMLTDGATILDIGAQSTRPGADLLNAETEWKRLEPFLKSLRKQFQKTILSVDTFHASVAERAIEEGADMINDISGGVYDAQMYNVVANKGVAYVLMHSKGMPQTMQVDPAYDDVDGEVLRYFAEKTALLKQNGVNDIILDPGFGFGKSLDHNFTLLKNLDLLKMTNRPVMVGLSRKSMINKVLHTSPDQALNGTTVLHTLALLKGADILRVHDVKEAVETIRLIKFTGA